MDQPTFPFSFEFEFVNALGHEHGGTCEGTYRFDGIGDPEIVTLTVAGGFSEWDDDAAYEAAWEYADEHVADICQSDWDQEYPGDFPLPTASESTAPMVSL